MHPAHVSCSLFLIAPFLATSLASLAFADFHALTVAPTAGHAAHFGGLLCGSAFFQVRAAFDLLSGSGLLISCRFPC